MFYFAQQGLNGLHSAAIYALLAFGYVLVNGLIRRTNLAYGPLFAFSGQILIVAANFAWGALWLEWWAALLLALALSALFTLTAGALIGRVVLAPLAGSTPNAFVVATLAAGIVLMELSRTVSGARDVWLPPLATTPLQPVPGIAATLTLNQMLGIAAAAVALVGLSFFMKHSRFGREWRAVADEPVAAAMCGVDVAAVMRRATLLSSAVAVLAAAIAAVYYGNIGLGAGLVYGLKVLFLAAAGSYSDPSRAALGGFAYGMIEAGWSATLPLEWRDGWMFGLLAAYLILRRTTKV